MFDFFVNNNNVLNKLKYEHPDVSNEQLWQSYESQGENVFIKKKVRIVDPQLLKKTEFKSEEVCPKCNKHTIIIIEEQTGGLDEGSKQVIKCLSCNYLSKSR